MKQKYYFRNEASEMCYTLNYHMEQARDDGLTEIELFTAIHVKVEGIIWCEAFDKCGDNGCCGRQCEDYKPRNGKSGICKHQGKLYVPDEKVKFLVKSEEEKKEPQTFTDSDGVEYYRDVDGSVSYK